MPAHVMDADLQARNTEGEKQVNKEAVTFLQKTMLRISSKIVRKRKNVFYLQAIKYAF